MIAADDPVQGDDVCFLDILGDFHEVAVAAANAVRMPLSLSFVFHSVNIRRRGLYADSACNPCLQQLVLYRPDPTANVQQRLLLDALGFNRLD